MHLTPSFNTYRSDLVRSASVAVTAPNTAVIASSSSSSLSSNNNNNNYSYNNISHLIISNIDTNSSRNNLIDRIVAATKHQKSLEIPSNDERLASVKRWQQRMFEKRFRIREHRRKIDTDDSMGRGRRELQRKHHHAGRNNNKMFNQKQQKQKRFCTAQDPATLAFEAPTVFEGKLTSMSPNRSLGENFSAVFEVVHKIKHHNGWELPRQVRLKFVRTNTIGCDIYREKFRERGYIKRDLEPMKHYFLFVKQIDLGNFTIVGVPLKKDINTTKGVHRGASDNYGKFKKNYFNKLLFYAPIVLLKLDSIK